MRVAALLFLASFLAVPLATSHAQVPKPDSAQVAAAAARAAKMRYPAEWALEQKQALKLDAGQIAKLETLVLAQRDSQEARQQSAIPSMMARMQNPAARTYMEAVSSWSGDIDEKAVREAVCQQSAMQADMMLAMMRDRRAVTALLTPAQQQMLPGLMKEMFLPSLPSRP